MKPYAFTRARKLFFISLLVSLVVLAVSSFVFEWRAQAISQVSNSSGFTIVFTQTVTSAQNGVKKLRGIHVLYRCSNLMTKDVKTSFNEDGTPDPPQIQQYLKRRHHSLLPESLRRNPSFSREEKVLGIQSFVLRYNLGSSSDEYVETFLAPELQGIHIKQIIVKNEAIEVIEPVSILFGEPDEEVLTNGQEKIDFSDGILEGYASEEIKPPYPLHLKGSRVSGTVQIQILISEEGKVIDAIPISGPPLLHEAALEAARQWVFTPTEVSRVPVKVQDILTFKFRLE
jgi:TonB family protein